MGMVSCIMDSWLTMVVMTGAAVASWQRHKWVRFHQDSRACWKGSVHSNLIQTEFKMGKKFLTQMSGMWSNLNCGNS